MTPTTGKTGREGSALAWERRIIAHVATSADGFIARRDGSVDWLERPMPEHAYGMAEFMRSVDTILWGRKTYDFAVKMGGVGVYGAVKHYAFSSNPPDDVLPGVEFVQEPIAEFAAKLKATPGKHIWMMGGAGIIGAFLDAGAIDEISLHVMPVLIGEGIPLLAPRHRHVELELVDSHAYEDGVVRLVWRVGR